MARRSAVAVRALGVGFALLLVDALLLPRVVTAQTSRPPQSRPERQGPPPKQNSASPFREFEFDGIRIKFLALNDEACPIRIQSGLLTRARGHRVLTVDVKSLSDEPLKTFVLTGLIFNDEGTFKADRTARAGRLLHRGQIQAVELTLDNWFLEAGDRVVLSVKDVTWTEGQWHSVSDEVLMAARDAVSGSTKP